MQLKNIEQCLELLANLQHSDLSILKEDYTIMSSIARQVFREKALTDRQFNLMSTKLLTYKEQFEIHGYENFDEAIHTLRQPLREIDRSKYIKLVDDPNSKERWIKVRFPFSKKLIAKLQSVVSNVSSQKYTHTAKSHEHFFLFDEKNVRLLLDTFSQNDFAIQNNLIEFYNKINKVFNNPQDNIPCIFDNAIKNVSENVLDIIKRDIPDLNIKKVCDRRFRYGITNINYLPANNSLEEHIISRESTDVVIKPSVYNLDTLVSTISCLDRFPLLIAVSADNPYRDLVGLHSALSKVIDNSKQSVLFRFDKFDIGNEYIKHHSLNNWVDSNTKVVYIIDNKFPKILLSSDWRPITSLIFRSNVGSQRKHIMNYIDQTSDLILFREETISPFRKYAYGKW